MRGSVHEEMRVGGGVYGGREWIGECGRLEGEE